jgi:hypothetical protein
MARIAAAAKPSRRYVAFPLANGDKIGDGADGRWMHASCGYFA